MEDVTNDETKNVPLTNNTGRIKTKKKIGEKLIVSGLNWRTPENLLLKYMESFGHIISVYVQYDKNKVIFFLDFYFKLKFNEFFLYIGLFGKWPCSFPKY